MAVVFDATKSERNAALRQLAFDLVDEFDWTSALIAEDGRRGYGERRLRVLGVLLGEVHALVVTFRGPMCGSSAFAGPTGRRSDAMPITRSKAEMILDDDDPTSRSDEENPEWTAEDFASARPASEVLPQLIGEAGWQDLLRRSRGRPAKPDRKVNQTLRLDPDVLEAYRSQGPGWQTKINQVLRDHMPRK